MGRESRLVGPRMPWVPRLLLLAALVLGIATMHTLGHPSAAHGGHGEPMAPVAQLAGAHDRSQVPDSGSARLPAGLHDGQPVSAVEPAAVAADVRPAVPAHGMDPMAVCLAVLVGWTLVLLAAASLLLRRSGDAAAAVRARVLRAVRALPPPGGGRTLLNRLSVLRQ
ncbi:hypothetical protein ACIBCA_29820 [Kitasatospora sp. NPDC051170]|uniref:hypothetical protein n=1 Tax=Kitasatospora sp. NPDC051170 TaxID=3364056 RepID=UPI0037AB014A